jgi:hypothetical protein
VKNVLLFVKESFEYNYEFRSVSVSDLEKLKNLLEIVIEQLTKNYV